MNGQILKKKPKPCLLTHFFLFFTLLHFLSEHFSSPSVLFIYYLALTLGDCQLLKCLPRSLSSGMYLCPCANSNHLECQWELVSNSCLMNRTQQKQWDGYKKSVISILLSSPPLLESLLWRHQTDTLWLAYRVAHMARNWYLCPIASEPWDL